MVALFDHPMNMFWWLVRPLFFWVKSKSTSDNLSEYLGLSVDQPVLYVLPKKSLVDLLVLYYHCLKHKLPLPTTSFKSLLGGSGASYLCMSKPGLLSTKSSMENLPPLMQLVNQVSKDDHWDIQVIPVSLFWGTNPGKEEPSLFKLIFNDDENAGALHKFFVVLAHGRNNLINISKPISIRQLIAEKQGVDQTSRKLRRILRVHFRIERSATLGSRLYVRDHVLARLIKSPTVKVAIEEESKKKRSSMQKASQLALKYAKEIAADQKYHVVKLFEIGLRKLWNKMYSGVKTRGFDRLRELAHEGYEIILVPCHRSHLDYLLLNYSIFDSGMPVPHTASGINLNFWPMGPLLRKTGAFFMRRSFSGNRLYSAVFNEYMQYLISAGFSISFFPEGGRSRTGRQLPLRTGMLAMVVQAFRQNPTKRVAVVPVYIGYDKLVEVGTYLKELSGGGKRRESMGQLLEARKILKKYWGHAYLSIGTAIDLGEFMGGRVDQWEQDRDEKKPAWLQGVVKDLAGEIAHRINRSVTITPSALVSMAMLSAPNRALDEAELLDYLALLVQLGDDAHELSQDAFAVRDPSKMVAACEQLEVLKKFEHSAGNVFYFNEIDSILNSYYKNNIMHVYVLPAALASFFRYDEELPREKLIASCLAIYPFLKEEFNLESSVEDARDIFTKLVETFVALGLIVTKGSDRLSRPDIASSSFVLLGHLGRILGVILERYALVTALVTKNQSAGKLNEEAFVAQCERMAQRLAILRGVTSPDLKEKTPFETQILFLKRNGLLRTCDDTAGELVVDAKVMEQYKACKNLLGLDHRSSMERLSSDLEGV